MEHTADALKMAFAILVFVIAITMIFLMVSKVKSTADIVLYYSDKTNFYAHYDEPNTNAEGNRIVTITEIVSTLYRYYKESVAVTIVDGTDSYYFDLGNESYIEVKDSDGNKLLELGTEDNIEENLGEFIKTVVLNKYDDKDTFVEEFTEVPTSGIYSTGSDGSEIILSAGGKKVYITYTK